ncbi:MAG: hypothetical protein H6Q04_2430 [Acidobacteria bacterium]|nr:hypothetical protein [Acidobacteriota bacterium]
MLLMVVDVENVLVEYHHTPTASEESAMGGYCASCALVSAMKFISCGRIHRRNSPSNSKLFIGNCSADPETIAHCDTIAL